MRIPRIIEKQVKKGLKKSTIAMISRRFLTKKFERRLFSENAKVFLTARTEIIKVLQGFNKIQDVYDNDKKLLTEQEANCRLLIMDERELLNELKEALEEFKKLEV